jgi:uncharacterized caspase-like protein
MSRSPKLLLALLAFSWLSPGSGVQAEGFALIVGVNDCPKFELPDGSHPRPLKGAEHDAEQFAALLIAEFGFPRQNVVLVRGAEATLPKLRASFDTLVRRIGVDDCLVFHFSGHGTRLPDRRPFDEADGLDEALCTYDATADGENLLVDDELGRWLDAVPARCITVLLDCCHAGTGTKEVESDVMPRYLPMAAVATKQTYAEEPWRDVRNGSKDVGRSRAALFACRPEQRAYERRIAVGGETIRAGQFSHFLLEGLRDNAADANGDNIVSNEEAAAFTTHRLDETFNRRRDRVADRQEPLLESDRADAPLFGLSK